MQGISDIKFEFNHLVSSIRGLNTTPSRIGKVALAAIRVGAYMATAGFSILAAYSLFTGNEPGAISCGLIALGSHEVYQVAKNIDENISIAENTIVLKPIFKLFSKIF